MNRIFSIQMESKPQSYCIGARHFSNTNIKVEYEKKTRKHTKFDKVRKRTCDFCGRSISQTFTL